MTWPPPTATETTSWPPAWHYAAHDEPDDYEPDEYVRGGGRAADGAAADEYAARGEQL